MSTELANITVPAFMQAQAALAAQLLAEAAQGIGGQMPPTLALKGTRFVIKKAGEDERILNVLELPVVVLRGKAEIEKKWYATKYVEGQETQSPDCFSMDGIKPDASARMKQCENCASCPQNVFGSGTNADGTPSGGKACADNKVIAVYINKEGIFRFAIPPASLGGFGAYCRQLGSKGIPLHGVLTKLGFDPKASFPKVSFTFGAIVNEAQYTMLTEMTQSEEALVAIGKGQMMLPAPASAGAAQVEHKATVTDIDEAKQKKEAEEKAKAEKAEKAAAAKKAKEEKEAKEKAAAAEKTAAAQAGGADLDLNLGGETEAAGNLDLGAASAEDIAAALDLGL